MKYASLYRRRLRERRRVQHALFPALTPHGTAIGYMDYGCRCMPCLDVQARRYQKRKVAP